MRRFDKDKHIAKANLLVEQRYLKSKGLLKEDSYIDADGELHLDGGFDEEEEEFFPDYMNLGFAMVFNVATQRIINKINIGSIPEASQYSSEDMEEYVRVLIKVMKDKKRPIRSVGTEILKKALIYYLEDLNEPTPEGKRPIVPIDDQREFINGLISKL